MSEKWIRASEISNYVYCRRAWWIQRKGHASQNFRELKRGNDFHKQHGLVWLRSVWGQRLAYLLLFLFVAFVTFQFLMSTQ